nr:proline-rich receptor-like protein kinase PERK2 [Aegilops tauschii subsp. strangulata]
MGPPSLGLGPTGHLASQAGPAGAPQPPPYPPARGKTLTDTPTCPHDPLLLPHRSGSGSAPIPSPPTLCGCPSPSTVARGLRRRHLLAYSLSAYLIGAPRRLDHDAAVSSPSTTSSPSSSCRPRPPPRTASTHLDAPLLTNAGEDPFVLPSPLLVIAVATLTPAPLTLNTTQATPAPSSSRSRLRRTRRPMPRELQRARVAIVAPVSPLVTRPPCPDRECTAPTAVPALCHGPVLTATLTVRLSLPLHPARSP